MVVEAVKAAAAGSWRTTAAGVATLVGALCTLVLVPMLDADPATLPHWPEFLGFATVALGLGAARDNRVSSEQAGAK